jgi:hypothetical protein
MEQRGRKSTVGGLNLYPSRKRRTPLKRYKVLATLPGKRGERIFLIIRARSKKNACFFAMQEYSIVKVEVVAILGKCKEAEEL